MKKFGKFLFGTLSLAAAAGGIYCLYKNRINKDADADFDDFDDDEDEDEDLTVSITITTDGEDAADSTEPSTDTAEVPNGGDVPAEDTDSVTD